MTLEEIKETAEGAILLDGFDDAIMGIVEEFGNGPRILYSKDKIISKLMNDMSEEDAIDYYYYNILGMYVNAQNALFLTETKTE
jgi:ferritin-like protein